jgi:hypothetical protein
MATPPLPVRVERGTVPRAPVTCPKEQATAPKDGARLERGTPRLGPALAERRARTGAGADAARADSGLGPAGPTRTAARGDDDSDAAVGSPAALRGDPRTCARFGPRAKAREPEPEHPITGLRGGGPALGRARAAAVRTTRTLADHSESVGQV